MSYEFKTAIIFSSSYLILYSVCVLCDVVSMCSIGWCHSELVSESYPVN
jgi:hypothetical protein